MRAVEAAEEPSVAGQVLAADVRKLDLHQAHLVRRASQVAVVVQYSAIASERLGQTYSTFDHRLEIRQPTESKEEKAYHLSGSLGLALQLDLRELRVSYLLISLKLESRQFLRSQVLLLSDLKVCVMQRLCRARLNCRMRALV